MHEMLRKNMYDDEMLLNILADNELIKIVYRIFCILLSFSDDTIDFENCVINDLAAIATVR